MASLTPRDRSGKREREKQVLRRHVPHKSALHYQDVFTTAVSLGECSPNVRPRHPSPILHVGGSLALGDVNTTPYQEVHKNNPLSASDSLSHLSLINSKLAGAYWPYCLTARGCIIKVSDVSPPSRRINKLQAHFDTCTYHHHNTSPRVMPPPSIVYGVGGSPRGF